MNVNFPRVLVAPDCSASLKLNLENGLRARFGLAYQITPYDHIRFKDGDELFQILDNVRERHVYIVVAATTDTNIMRCMKMIDSALLASASGITVVYTYFPGRADRKDRARVGITAALIARLTMAAFGESDSKKVMVFEPHCDQLEMAFNGVPVDKLWATEILRAAFHQKFQVSKSELSVGGPDSGSLRLVRKLAQVEGLDSYFHGDKRRVADDQMRITNIIGDVNKYAIVRDDLSDTAGTLCECIRFLETKGAEHAFGMIAHGIFADQAVDRLKDAQANSILRHVFLTDSVNTDHRSLPPDLFTIVSCGDLLAEAIYLNHTGGSLTQMAGMH
jgi:ribose-phosphate pyrophosphokinase